MFHYEQYLESDMHRIRLFVDSFPLAMITTFSGNEWQCSHIPLFWRLDKCDELFGHVDACNPQFSGAPELDAHIAFCGPNAFIPPEAYSSHQLPTWNYLAVHARAQIVVDRDPERNFAVLSQTASRLEARARPFNVSGNDERIQRWIGSICGLHIKISQVEGRFKLSQDKSPEDVKSASKYFLEQSRKQLSAYLLNVLVEIEK